MRDQSIPRIRRRLAPVLASLALAALGQLPALLAPAVVSADTAVYITSAPSAVPLTQLSCWDLSPENCILAPASVQAAAGTAVVWINQSGATHNLVGDDGSFAVPVALQGRASHVFTTAGVHPYHCTRHPSMRGSVTVPAPPPPPPAPAVPATATTTRALGPATAAAPPASTPGAPAPSPPAVESVPLPDPAVGSSLPPLPVPPPTPRALGGVQAARAGGRSPALYLTGALVFISLIGGLWLVRRLRGRPKRPGRLLGDDDPGWMEL